MGGRSTCHAAGGYTQLTLASCLEIESPASCPTLAALLHKLRTTRNALRVSVSSHAQGARSKGQRLGRLESEFQSFLLRFGKLNLRITQMSDGRCAACTKRQRTLSLGPKDAA